MKRLNLIVFHLVRYWILRLVNKCTSRVIMIFLCRKYRTFQPLKLESPGLKSQNVMWLAVFIKYVKSSKVSIYSIIHNTEQTLCSTFSVSLIQLSIRDEIRMFLTALSLTVYHCWGIYSLHMFAEIQKTNSREEEGKIYHKRTLGNNFCVWDIFKLVSFHISLTTKI